MIAQTKNIQDLDDGLTTVQVVADQANGSDRISPSVPNLILGTITTGRTSLTRESMVAMM